jgi:uncharacterized membrane protein YeaQ/YmgE (transglycosylase-associated protein family)
MSVFQAVAIFVIGVAVGVLARAFLSSRDDGGMLTTAITGAGGAFLGSYAGQSLGWYRPGDNLGLLFAMLGAFVLLLAMRALRGRL